MVCASLDILDGVGEHAIYMYSEEFTTEKGLDNEMISTNQSSINASFDQKNGVTITNSKLYIGEELNLMKFILMVFILILNID